MGHSKFVITLPLAGLLAAGCSTIAPYESGLQEQGALYRPGFGGIEEAIPLGRERQAGKYRIRLELDPNAPGEKDEVDVVFVLSDTSGGKAVPVTGAKLACTARMTKVPGHIHNLKIHTQHPEESPGRYIMHPVRLNMAGRWDIVVQVQMSRFDQFYAVFPVKVGG